MVLMLIKVAGYVVGKNIVLERADQIGAAGYDGCFAAGKGGFGLRQGLCIRMIESFHVFSPMVPRFPFPVSS